ncbi:hypothetical protein MYX06_05340, partial [Patescibacteria group bacterium AH-259-L05]|nr:hypothetical protein [Patescibacteria group bacterium AH-259-L05]
MLPKASEWKYAKKFDWDLYPQAEIFLNQEIRKFLKNNNTANKLAKLMQTKTSSQFFCWIDHMVIPIKESKKIVLKKLGFQETEPNVFRNTKTVLFPIVLRDEDVIEFAIKPENLDDFVKKNNVLGKIKGAQFAPYRYIVVNEQSKFRLSAVERRGYNGFVVQDTDDISRYKKALKVFSKRKRSFSSDKEGLVWTNNLVKLVVRNLSKGRAADAFFRNERAYWQKRNKAGQAQKSRQDVLGLGWGNHDHHTYRSSRENFLNLVRIFKNLGLECRERFYAGEMAGWGAQILEHPLCDIVVFSDVDLSKKEKGENFSHKGLKSQITLGTVGLWVGLHGESILQPGMHHFEARFEFDQLRRDLLKQKIKFMKPFSYFPFLKQTFTEGERWKVEKKRADLLLERGSINKVQYSKFLKQGAIGSHLENLQRKQGFKGFNQESVSAIIKATDPRKQLGMGA